MVFPAGPLINALAIVAGSLLGIFLGTKLSENMRNIVFQGLGLCVIVIGLQMAFKTGSPVVCIFSVLLGGITGELCQLEKHFTDLTEKIKQKIKLKDPQFTVGVINSSVIFCIGAMAICGSFDEGLRGDRTLVYSKSILDCFTAMAFASIYGYGVTFSAGSVFIYQGALVVFSGIMQPFLTDALVNELTAVGGILVLGIGLNLLNLTKINLTNMLPAILYAVVLSCLFL